jgi:fumarate reductase flavoprotein subunit
VKEIGGQLDLKTTKAPMFSPTHHPFFLSMVWMSNDPRMLMVNSKGARYLNESVPTGQTGALETQPEHYGYAIFDAPTAEQMGQALVERTAHGDNAEDMKKWKQDLEYECTLDRAAKKANSIEELAQLIHIDPAALAETIRVYNEGCASGQDAMGKPSAFLSPVVEAPFYALFQGRFNEGAVGGIVNDDHLRLVNRKDQPFRGIYLAGDCCRGVLKWDDQRTKFGEMPWAMASGYLAGAEMAAYTG